MENKKSDNNEIKELVKHLREVTDEELRYQLYAAKVNLRSTGQSVRDALGRYHAAKETLDAVLHCTKLRKGFKADETE